MSPVRNPFSPVFSAFCYQCSRTDWSGNLATGPQPFTYLCWACQSGEVRKAVADASRAAWESLSAHERQTVRMRMFGRAATREIELRERAAVGR